MPEFLNNCSMADIPLELLLASKGDIFYIDERMGIYRRNKDSLTSKISQRINGRKNYIYMYFNMMKYLFPKKFYPLSIKLLLTTLGFVKDFQRKLFMNKILILTFKIFRRILMYLFKIRFKSVGNNVIFNPFDQIDYKNIMVGNDVYIGGGATFAASESQII